MAGGSLIQHVTGHNNFNNGKYHFIKTNKGDTHNAVSSHHQMMYPFDMEETDYELLAWTEQPRSRVYLDGENEMSRIPPVEPEIGNSNI